MKRLICLSVILAALLLAAALAGGCRGRRPSVILVSIDSLRYDDAFGSANGRPMAPRLQRLAADARVFDRAYSAAPWTTPSMMSVMSGLPAPAHGVEEHDRALAASLPTLAERFRAAGYATAAFVPEITLRPEFGFGRGFDTYDLENFGHERLSSPTLVGKVLERLARFRAARKPFFLWVHLWDPHYNYIPPPPYDAMFPAGTEPPSQDLQCLKWARDAVTPPQAEFLRGRYRGEIAYTDRYLGDLLDALAKDGADRDVVLAVMADHGEAFGEHHWLTHTNRVDDEVVHVPLLLRWPGHVTPGRERALVATSQLGATLLELAGLDAHGFGSQSALPLGAARGEAAAGVVSETIRQGCYTAFVAERYKAVLDHRTCAVSVFDLAADPGETRDLAPADPALAGRLRGELRTRLEAIRRAGVPKGTLPPEVVHEAEAALRSLGYVGGPGAAVPSGCPLAPAAGRDSFGDTLAAACPSDGAMACLSR